jgi:chromosome segregation ATPase
MSWSPSRDARHRDPLAGLQPGGGFGSSHASHQQHEQTSEGLSPNSKTRTLRDQEMMIGQLQKTNFDMKLRIFYLEERLAKLRPGGDSPEDESLQEELFQQKLLIEEKTQELEDRNLLLIKARNAIESLQADLEMAQAETDEVRRQSASNRVVAEKEHALQVQEDKIRALERKDLEQLQQITSLTGQVGELSLALKSRASELESSQRCGRELEEKVSTLRGDVDGLNRQSHRDSEVKVDLQVRAFGDVCGEGGGGRRYGG